MIQVTAASHRHEDNSDCEFGLLDQRLWGSLALQPRPLPTPPEPINLLLIDGCLIHSALIASSILHICPLSSSSPFPPVELSCEHKPLWRFQ